MSILRLTSRCMLWYRRCYTALGAFCSAYLITVCICVIVYGYMAILKPFSRLCDTTLKAFKIPSKHP